MESTRAAKKIAIIGLGCRFPGGSDSPEKFWELIKQSKNTVADIPPERWQVNRFYNDSDSAAAKSYVRKGHFIDWDYTTFDANFFDFAPREVEYFDPQQRLLLEVSWEAMENAGIDPTSLAGRHVGVYMGGFTLDHMLNQLGSSGRSEIGAHSAAGATLTMLSNRISYVYDFIGPSITVDTACSSSLVAFSYAVNDMKNGACEMALVGGVNFMLRPEYPIAMSKGHFLARDGISKSFDARADGYGRGEGAGIVVLKLLDDAINDGDRVLAVVEAAGVNQDGRTNGITVPNPDSQKSLMIRTVSEAGLDPKRVHYVEAHGTGTSVGDPIEASAIAAVYGVNREVNTPCRIGSVKSNIGHCEAAAGVAGIIKACLMLVENQVPALATLTDPNPAIPFGDNGLALADRLTSLAPENQTRFISVNSFGYGGTNAHAILSHPYKLETVESHKTTGRHQNFKLLPISARDDEALRSLASRCAQHLRNSNDALEDILYTLSRRRAHLSNRLAVWGKKQSDLLKGLESYVKKDAAENVAHGIQSFTGNRGPVFVFTGMGPQWWGMGHELYQKNEVFRQSVDDADDIFREIAGFSIREEIMKPEEESRITETQLAQPANFVIQYALTQLLRAEGLSPAAVVGHSVGEISSAWASGMLSLREALLIACYRSRIQSKAAGQGGMLAVSLGYEQVMEIIAEDHEKVSVAAVNSPTSITLSGDQERLDKIQSLLESQQIFARRLAVEVPYHSPMMDPLLSELLNALATLNPIAPTLPLYSTVSGERVEEIRYDGEYWCRNVREPVFFEKAVRSMLDDGYTVFVEVGPHPVLRNALKEIFTAHSGEARSLQTLHHKQSDLTNISRTVAEVFAQGADLKWEVRHPQGRLVSLPNYPWQRRRLWRESEHQRRDRIIDAERPLLGVREAGMSVWRADLADYRLDYLNDHRVDNMPIMPAAGYLEAMLEAVASGHTKGGPGWRLSDIRIEKALMLDSAKNQFMESRMATDGRSLALYSYSDNDPQQIARHAEARIYPLIGYKKTQVEMTERLQCIDVKIQPDVIYQDFAGLNMQYGPMFQPINELRVSKDRQQVLAHLILPDPLAAQSKEYIAHPSLLDGCFQTVLSLSKSNDGAFLPTAIKDLCVYRPLSKTLWCHTLLIHRSARTVECDITLIGEDGVVEASVQGLVCTALQGKSDQIQYPSGDYVYTWKQEALSAEDIINKHWMVVADDRAPLAVLLCEKLKQSTGKTVELASWQSDNVLTVLETVPFDAVAFVTGSDFSDTKDPMGEVVVHRLLQVLQALGKRQDAPRIYTITQEAFSVDGKESPSPIQGALAGMTRVAFNELGQLRPTTIDLPRPIDDEILAALTRELLTDDTKDEVALRRNGRYFSELSSSGIFAKVPEVSIKPDEGDRFTLREESRTGNIRLISCIASRIDPNEFELSVEAVSMTGTSAVSKLKHLDDKNHMMGVCARVTRVGSSITHLHVGDRLCGFTPVSLSSHICVTEEDSLLINAPEDVCATTIACSITLHILARQLIKRAALGRGDRAVICETPLGLILAELLQAEGVQIERFPGNKEQWSISLWDAINRQGEITTIAAPLFDWNNFFGFDGLAEGGCLIDLDQKFAQLDYGPRVGHLVRTAANLEIKRNQVTLRETMYDVVLQGVTTPEAVENFELETFINHRCESVSSMDQLVIDYKSNTSLKAIAVDDPVIKPNASYLITGGFGGLGKETAKWLAHKGAGHIILAGRSAGQSEADRAFMTQLERQGSKASSYCCDVTDLNQVQELVSTYSCAEMPLLGVFHAVGMIDDKPISEMSAEDLFRVMQPKALGAWNLHISTQSLSLDHFVLFSSISVLVGNSNQANYCAANGFLDTLAHLRHTQGKAALSINWGAIAGVGMLSQDDAIGQHLKQIGLSPIDFAIALNGMTRAMSVGIHQICIASDPDWNAWARYESYGGRSPRFQTLIERARAQADDSVQTRLFNKLAKLNLQQRRQVLTALIADIFTSELKMPADQINDSRPLESLGIDSLLATEISACLAEYLGISVSALELIGEMSICKIATKGLEQMQLDLEQPLDVAA